MPPREQLLTYCRAIQTKYTRWADVPEESDPEAPLFDQNDLQADTYIDTKARPLPMKISPFRQQPMKGEGESQELLTILDESSRAIILGEPGSGKTTALERLAWQIATQTLVGAENPAQPLILPLLVRLAEYGGEADLLPLCVKTLQRQGLPALNQPTLHQLLTTGYMNIILLLDGLNEIDPDHQQQSTQLVREHCVRYPHQRLYVTCRTADFDLDAQSDPNRQIIEPVVVFQVQRLVDTIRYWDDETGESDIRSYLRRHLGNQAGKTLYERIQPDERLYTLAQRPLFLWMYKEAAGEQEGEFSTNRGALLRAFIHAPRLLGQIPAHLRGAAERSLEEIGWTLQDDIRNLDLDEQRLYKILETVRGQRQYDLDEMRRWLQETSLLIQREPGTFALQHQLIQEYAAAAYLIRQPDCGERFVTLAHDEWWRETLILALWLQPTLQEPDVLLGLMENPQVDLRVRITAATILGEKDEEGRTKDPRFVYHLKSLAEPVEANGPLRQAQGAGRRAYILPSIIAIPGGAALLGGEDGDEHHDDELPQCTVEIVPFALGQYPVTNAEYGCFMQAGGYAEPSFWTDAGQAWLAGEGKLGPETEQIYRNQHRRIAQDVEGYIASLKQTRAISEQDADTHRQIAAMSEDEFVQAYANEILSEQRRKPYWWDDSRFNQPTQPVVGVNWYEALAYTRWLAQLTGEPYTLPTEAQWEWAARRHQSDDPNRRYPWGDGWDSSRCNSALSRFNAPNPVGVFSHGATTNGLHDLAGNVYEWTKSLYRMYPYDPQVCEAEEAEGLRSIRGGSWHNSKESVRCGSRNRNDEWNWYYYLGFRLARASFSP